MGETMRNDKTEKILLEVKNLSVRYGYVKAIENVSFKVNKCEIVAMIGPNGAGKSTTLKAVSGLLDAAGGTIDSGEIFFDGKNIKGLRTDELAGMGIALIPEGRRVFPTLTVLENIEMGAYLRSDTEAINQDIEKVFVLFPQLKERINQRAGSLSGGEQQMLAMARALMLRPKLLIADEPSLGLSPNFVEIIFEKFAEINNTGTSILIVEQNAIMALEHANRGYVFKIGKIFLEGQAKDLIKNEEIKKSFLGQK